jgi:signal peptidase I
MEPIPNEAASSSARTKLMSLLRELVVIVLLALVIFMVVSALVESVEVYLVSMDPSLEPGQRLLVNKAVYLHVHKDHFLSWLPFLKSDGDKRFLFHPPRRGEVVVFKPPVDDDREYIKRIIGVPGDTVEIKEGNVYLNGEPLDEPYIKEPIKYTMPPRQVPKGEYFVLGDNRNNSSDSHVWGTVPLDNIVGKASLSYWPLGDLGWAPNHSIKVAAK